MGAWGDGLLDSDNAQDFIGKFVRGIEQDVIEIHEMKSPKLAGNLSAAVGILLRLSHPFDPMPNIDDPPHFYPRLVCALSANFLHYMNYPEDAPRLLAAILSGHGSTLSDRPAKLSKQIKTCLLSGPPGVLQGDFSKLETSLFSSPSAKTYLRLKSKELIKGIDTNLKNRDSVIDMSYTDLGGMFGLLLVLPVVGLKSKKIEAWRKRCHSVWESAGSDDDANDIEFERGFRKNVDRAFKCAAKMYG